jgi:hypothetical protein
MPVRRKGALPVMRLHKPSGAAHVNVNGRRIYFGKYGSAEAQDRYNDFIAQYVAASEEQSSESVSSCDGAKSIDVNQSPFGSQDGFIGRYPQLPTVWYYPSLLPQEIPDVSAVYVVLNSKYEVIYVGETQSMQRRYTEHKRWLRRRHKFAWIEVAPSERLFVQCHFIAALRPTKNKLPGTRAVVDVAVRNCVAMLQPVRLMVRPVNKPAPAKNKEVACGR